MVYVLDRDGRLLMPTGKHAYVRILLKSGRASVACVHPFTIKLNYDTTYNVRPVVLGIDPGRTNIGLCAVDESGKSLFTAEVRTRNKDIPWLMAARRAFRMAHRKHRRREKRQRRALVAGTVLAGGKIERRLPSYGKDKTVTCNVIRNKQARFSNRRRPEGWLTPTASQLLRTHLNLVRKVSKFLPVSKVVLELNRFAFMRLDDPSVSGSMFQHGPLYGYDGSVESAVYALQDGKCLLCGAPIGQYHHVRERRRDGSETVRNRVGLCTACHGLVHTDGAERDRLASVAAGMRKKYDALGVLNQIIPRLMKGLSVDYEVSVTAGWETEEFRELHGIPKDHYLDAYAIACSALDNFEICIPHECYHIRQFRRHDRQACKREMLNRNYVLDGKAAAQNRHKAMGQKADSLEEYIAKGGRTDRLKVKHARRAMKDMARHYPGCQVVHNGRVRTLLKRASGSYWFDDGSKSPVRRTDITLNNSGLVFVSNTLA